MIGHTHLPVYAVYWNNRPIINPGSLGLGKDGILRFVIAEINDGIVDIAYKQLRYDKEKVILDYHRFEVPEGETFIRKFF